MPYQDEASSMVFIGHIVLEAIQYIGVGRIQTRLLTAIVSIKPLGSFPSGIPAQTCGKNASNELPGRA